MLNMGYFEVAYNEDNHLKVTSAGRDVLFGHAKAQLVVIKREETVKSAASKKKKRTVAQPEFMLDVTPIPGENHDLFEELRLLRKKLADQQAIPAYIVLSDKTLHLIAQQQPRTIEEFGTISGIGEYKRDKYGKEFLEVINRVLK
jgi:ATP-dependent DNA helicase RecQ